MPSTINRTLPVQNSPMLSNEMRQQFGRAADDIDALQTGKANLASPALTGTPTAPTAATTTNTTQIATTAFVRGQAIGNLQGNPVTAGTLGAGNTGQVLTWSGSNWAPTAATGGVPDPQVLAFRPVPADLNNWIPPGTAGVFACMISSIITNGPPQANILPYHVTATSDTNGRIFMRAQRISPDFYYRMTLVRERWGSVASGWWTPWRMEQDLFWHAVQAGDVNITLTSTPQLLPHVNDSYTRLRHFWRWHVYRPANPSYWPPNTLLYPWQGTSGYGLIEAPLIGVLQTPLAAPNPGELRVFNIDANNMEHYRVYNEEGGPNELIYIAKVAGGNQNLTLNVSVMAAAPNIPPWL